MAYTTIKKPSDYFNTKLYTGNGVGGTNITGVGFQPDLVWIKRRSGTENHVWNDAVRGVPNNIYSSSTNAQDSGNLMSAILSDGFTVQTDASVNSNNDTYASWNWKANGAGSSNTDGTITSTVSASATSGFSIAKYTGTGANASFGHGLGTTPAVYIIKKLTGASTWLMYHQSLGIGYHLGLNNTTAQNANDATFANNTAPDTSKIYLGSWGDLNANGSDFICYSFADVQGYSKFGKYTGNGNANGTFVYTGFKPSFIMVKRTDSSTGGSWIVYDTKRNPYNVSDIVLATNDASSEAGWGYVYDLDILSNGFKWRNDGGSGYVNVSGASYIYMAFAEEPLVGDNPATAR